MAQCEICGTEVVQGRGRARRTCSAACRQKSHRQRQAEQLAALRATATSPALALVPPTLTTASAPDGSPAGRIRAAGADLAAAIEHAALRAAKDWDTTELVQGIPRYATPSNVAADIRSLTDRVVAAVLASTPASSRNGPEPGTDPADAVTAPTGSFRDEPTTAVPAPTTPESPATDTGSSRNDPPVKPVPARRKRLTQKAARAIADSAQLVKDPGHRDNHRWNVVADDGTVLGHVEPSYGGTSRSGRNGWKYRLRDSFGGHGPYKTREQTAVHCALAWVRVATAPVHRTLTGD